MLWKNDTEKFSNQVQKFTQDSEELEIKLLPYDILGTMAHVKMLEKQGYLKKKDLKEVEVELKNLYQEEKIEDFEKYEDVHTFIEEKVTKKTEAGKKIHTGRSRNDQVVTATRLLMKDSTVEIALNTLKMVKALEKFAEEENTLMPGYTHQQQAMPSSTGLWASSFVDAFLNDLKLLKNIYQLLDSNPLGAAASYGTCLNIDRNKTAELLGFDKLQQNPIYCGNRGKHELMLLQALNQIMLDIQKLSEDLINFSEDQEIFEIPEEFCTGSSIMPQKSNPDVLELSRAKAEEVNASVQAVHGVISKLPSGYNRDTQQTKKHLIESVETVQTTIDILTSLVEGLEVSENFEVKEEIYAAYTANQMVEDGIPFRKAYKEVKKNQEYEKKEELKPPKNQKYCEMEEFWKKKQKAETEVENKFL